MYFEITNRYFCNDLFSTIFSFVFTISVVWTYAIIQMLLSGILVVVQSGSFLR